MSIGVRDCILMAEKVTVRDGNREEAAIVDAMTDEFMLTSGHHAEPTFTRNRHRPKVALRSFKLRERPEIHTLSRRIPFIIVMIAKGTIDRPANALSHAQLIFAIGTNTGQISGVTHSPATSVRSTRGR